MIIFKTVIDLHFYLKSPAKAAVQVGFVPTMGALHDGHISLIKTSKQQDIITVCSIFVNPTQFNDPADFEKYPVTLNSDIYKLESAGCDILFLPSVKEIYPDETSRKRNYELGFLETVLEGKYRPGHFQGVCMVVERLLEIVQPKNLYLGQKDYQQCMVIERLIHIMNAGNKIKLNVCPTLREGDGLAMSSRNMRLSSTEREKAVIIYKCLDFIKNNLAPGDLTELKNEVLNSLVENGFKADYAEIANAATLKPVTNWDGKEKLVVLIAAFLNEVRLIDNILLN
jgi:pantoate--beta-alanine ligase